MCDRATFESRFPEFSAEVLDKYFDNALNEYQCYYSQSCLDDSCSDLAACMVVAHLIVIDNTTSASPLKDVASRAVDGVSISYIQSTKANPSDTNLFFSTTKYGKRFLQLTSGCGYGAVFFR